MLRGKEFDVIIIGAGAAGMMCAIEAGRRGRRVMVLDHARAPGEKIRISGGGRCNFTNLDVMPARFLSANPAFCISALKRYTPRHFLSLVETHGIAWHEKTLGQLFCDGSARQIVDMLLAEMRLAGVELRLSRSVDAIGRMAEGFSVSLTDEVITCRSLVVATGGKSIPKMGATGFGYDIAGQFGLVIVPTRPGLVPLTLDPHLLDRLAPLAGVSVSGRAMHARTAFDEAILFTHRGLSGPAILQISSYWREGDEIVLSLLPEEDVLQALREERARNGRQAVQTALAALLPRRLAQYLVEATPGPERLADAADSYLRSLARAVGEWRMKPVGSEGYRTAEVTLGGVDTRELDQRTMQARNVPGLYFIGEVVDVTGWLGGYNFQWAWASGWCAGQSV
ncbi:BaiN/RdsA family NAD(P)/FAD-dependent oxidoreductase [Ancylobacter terrae]|uniref:NAD(P)/FAD-dependent oxidoreductase n=1 Tax=Ancylobacter sp. sgz301288 TaxID=3342077 RepID=UPI00385E5E60